tara:strand:- start:839 stop:997 length:159 start_codon:yes stop_codon:yes gene_type:complete
MSKEKLTKEEIEDIKHLHKNLLKGLTIPKKYKEQREQTLKDNLNQNKKDEIT